MRTPYSPLPEPLLAPPRSRLSALLEHPLVAPLVMILRPPALLFNLLMTIFLKLLGLLLLVKLTYSRWRMREGEDRLAPPPEGRVDYLLVGAICSICALGLLMVYSASVTRASHAMGSGTHFLKQQSTFMCLGLLMMFFFSKYDYRFLKRYAWYIFGASLIALVLVFMPGLGKSAKGASRWLNLGVINVQPIEIVKLSLSIVLARLFSDPRTQLNRQGWSTLCLVTPGVLLILQPDFGSIVILGYIYFVALLLSGAQQRLLIGATGIVGLAGVVMWNLYSHVSRRIYEFLAQFDEGAELGYNLHQALISFGSGRWVGEGVGRSSQKNFFLPESHTDFIFDIYGEELGFIGVIGLLALYTTVLSRGLLAARRASDRFGAMLAALITLLFFTQALVNMMMAVGMLPTKGLTLPLMSYGGSSLVIVCAGLGVLLNISRYRAPERPALTPAAPLPSPPHPSLGA